LAVEVHKFGGTSVSSVDGLRTAVRVAEDGGVVLVVSAFAGVTDELERLVVEAASGGAVDPGVPLSLCEERAEELGVAEDGEVREVLGEVGDLLRSVVVILRQLGRPDPRLRDLVLSVGERVAARVVAAFLRSEGVEARAFDSWDIGLVTSDQPGNADIVRWEGTRGLVEGLVEDGVVPVVTGFIGRSVGGYVTTLGRGGSDYTAAVLAGVLGSDAFIWTDVDGIMTADPGVVEAEVVPRLSYEEAVIAGASGAEVLHPKAVEAAMNMGVVIRVGNSFTGRVGTVVCEGSPPGPKVVAHRLDVVLLTVRGAKMVDEPGVIGRITSALGDAGVNVLAISSAVSEPFVNVLVSEDDAEAAAGALDGLEGYDWGLREDVGVVTVVGRGVDPSLVRVEGALVGCSALEGVAYTVVVPEEDVEGVVRGLARVVTRSLRSSVGGGRG